MVVIGIDLGTSNSLVATWRDDGPQPIENALNDILTPSAVSIGDDGEILIGRAAIDRLATHPDRTVASFKRAMGSSQVFQVGTYRWRAEELSALILKSLREDAEARLGQTIDEAVISVPAYFNDVQRKATLDAAALAGLRVERLINEPTAAALAHGLENAQEGSFLILDLGGGTFDVSLLEKYDDVMEIRASAGDTALGGDDFREVLINALMERHDLSGDALSPEEKGRIFAEAERVKRALSDNANTTYHFTTTDSTYSGTISREQFEEISQSLLRRLRAPIDRAIRDARIKPEEIDQVVLVGGASRMPMIRALATRMFGRFPLLHARPDHIVGLGAAVQAALKTRHSALKEIVMTDVCPFTLGTAVHDPLSPDGSTYSPIIERNAVVPISRLNRYRTVSNGQTEILFQVLQGESMRPSQNIRLGDIQFKIPTGPAGHEAIDVRYTYDINGALEVEATVVSTGQTHRKFFRNQDNLTEEELAKRFAALSSTKLLPRDQRENRALIAWAERLYAESLGETREQIRALLTRFELDIQNQSSRHLDAVRQDFAAALTYLERPLV
ncbi:molecular chaperone HscC [Allorhizobium taibaishanense]|uniref:Molecular chaperone HscC n=1 Tax=Allorhizobium taibaishanense TaxID=887144 RepID=A0A1Q9A1D1_9HYPH|nr:molecular chaperone HscC [Allorhizobium taibaishanense]MBB4009337.1 molecular chaperone HscC [Allorhizobium taibaishanense]OLP48407.1 molecular chaperone HscC [Allorhizobium taibaishanense]